MPKLTIITSSPQEVAQIKQACRFTPLIADIQLELICKCPHECSEPDATCIKHFSQLSLSGMREATSLVYFSDRTAQRDFQADTNLLSPILYIHPNMAILELWDSYALPPEFFGNNLTACMLHSDNAANLLLAPEDKDNSPSPRVKQYSDFADYAHNKLANEVLITSNHNLVNALTLFDKDKWTRHYPAYPASDLAMDYLEPHQLQQKLIQIFSKAISGKSQNDIFQLVASRDTGTNMDSAYSFFAEHYDEYMAHVDYELWVNRILGWQSTYSDIKLATILELACGTANISTRLVHRGYNVDACDLSANMLAVADKKDLKPKLYQASLTDPIPGSNYHLVICMFDSVNYLLRTEQISAMLAQVYDSLASGGLYIFDISTLCNSEENFADICNMHYFQDGYMVHQAWFESMQLSQKSSLHFFKEHSLGFSLAEEQHTQRVYYCRELIELIKQTQFTLLAIHSTETKMNLFPRHLYGIDDKFPRLFFVLKKQ